MEALRGMDEAELWASWDAEATFQICFWCEDRPAVGKLILVHAKSSKPVKRRRKGDSQPVVCDFCRWDCNNRIVELPGDRPGRWVFVEFRR